MKTKPILAALASATTGFFGGWLIFGMALAGFYEANMTHYDGLMKEPPEMWGFIVGNLSIGVLFTYIFHYLSNVSSFGKGFIAALIITFFVSVTYDVYWYSGMNLYSGTVIVVDVIANSLLGGLMGGVAALVLGSGKKDLVG
jgi:hypothetical protein